MDRYISKENAAHFYAKSHLDNRLNLEEKHCTKFASLLYIDKTNYYAERHVFLVFCSACYNKVFSYLFKYNPRHIE